MRQTKLMNGSYQIRSNKIWGEPRNGCTTHTLVPFFWWPMASSGFKIMLMGRNQNIYLFINCTKMLEPHQTQMFGCVNVCVILDLLR